MASSLGCFVLAVGSMFLIPRATLSAESTATPTFTKDIAPIFQAKCEACHRPNSMAPMSLVTYEEARPWARAIGLRVGSRQMPPWHIDKTVGIQEFKNDRSLSDQQIDTIVRWVEAGAPKGDPKDMPAPKNWPDESKWQLAAKYGQPDLVIKSAPYDPGRCTGRLVAAHHGRPALPSHDGFAPSRSVPRLKRDERSHIMRSRGFSSRKPCVPSSSRTTPTS